jgi:hypothetical protein
MSTQLRFDLAAVLRLAEHTIAASHKQPSFTEDEAGTGCPGALVWSNDHGVYLMSGGRPGHLELEPVAGGARVRANPQFLVPAPPQPEPGTGPVIGVPHQRQPAPLVPGQLVTVAGPGWRRPPESCTSCPRKGRTGR